MPKKLTNGDIVQKMYDLVGDEYTKVDDIYEGALVKFGVRHETCGFEYMVTWGDFKKGRRCPKCSKKHQYTDSEMTEIISDMTNGEYTKLSEYKNAHSKFKIKHNTCGQEYEVKWTSFQGGRRCPKCKFSRGEKAVNDYLTNQNVSFTTQVRFDDCRSKYPLPFDFGIIDSEKKVIALIEYDGKQHFEPVEIWGGEEALKQVQLRDSIKNDYCRTNNIPLLRIHHDKNIEEELDNFLASLFILR